MNPAPRTIPMAPSVAMNGGSCTAITRSETSRPDSDADEQARGDARRKAPAGLDQSPPVTTLASAMTAPGDRSIPPEMMTIAAPIAAMP